MTPGRQQNDDHEEDDGDLFEEAMQGVQPIRRGPSRISGALREPSPPANAGKHNLYRASPAVETWGQRVEWLATDASPKRIQELRSDKVVPEGTLDLHGLTVSETELLLSRFLKTSQAQHHRYILVIHGRGIHSGSAGPRLRRAIVGVLSSLPLSAAVLAFVDAPSRLGGPGALLVMLRCNAPQ